jgi:hypothetical protein
MADRKNSWEANGLDQLIIEQQFYHQLCGYDRTTARKLTLNALRPALVATEHGARRPAAATCPTGNADQRPHRSSSGIYLSMPHPFRFSKIRRH